MTQTQPPGDIIICDADGAADMAEVGRLFSAYAAAPEALISAVAMAAEIRGLPGPYAAPRGAIMLARAGVGRPAVGCVALRPMPGPGDCECRRLYVTPEMRGKALGRRLSGAIGARAIALGYRRIVLTTDASLPYMTDVYRRRGFVDIAPYFANPRPGTAYLALDLTRLRP